MASCFARVTGAGSGFSSSTDSLSGVAGVAGATVCFVLVVCGTVEWVGLVAPTPWAPQVSGEL